VGEPPCRSLTSGAEPDGNAEELGHFARIGATDAAAQTGGFAIHHQLHQHPFVARQRAYRAEAGFVDIDLA
jgi:hypothetical protein